jgi:hypothetical protein
MLDTDVLSEFLRGNLTHIAANPTVLIHYQQNTDF